MDFLWIDRQETNSATGSAQAITGGVTIRVPNGNANGYGRATTSTGVWLSR